VYSESKGVSQDFGLTIVSVIFPEEQEYMVGLYGVPLNSPVGYALTSSTFTFVHQQYQQSMK
jgi:hypothetical protein